jgi:hypothetical protein
MGPRRGVVCQFKVMDGTVSKGEVVTMMNTGKEYQLDEIGVLAPHKVQVSRAAAGPPGCWPARLPPGPAQHTARHAPAVSDGRCGSACLRGPQAAVRDGACSGGARAASPWEGRQHAPSPRRPGPAALASAEPQAPALLLSSTAPPHPLAQVDTLYCGEVGYLAASIKSVQDARVGDTVTTCTPPGAARLCCPALRRAPWQPSLALRLPSQSECRKRAPVWAEPRSEALLPPKPPRPTPAP